MPENTAVVKLEALQTSDFQAIAVGGHKFGKEQNTCYAVQFYLNQQNLV